MTIASNSQFICLGQCKDLGSWLKAASAPAHHGARRGGEKGKVVGEQPGDRGGSQKSVDVKSWLGSPAKTASPAAQQSSQLENTTFIGEFIGALSQRSSPHAHGQLRRHSGQHNRQPRICLIILAAENARQFVTPGS